MVYIYGCDKQDSDIMYQILKGECSHNIDICCHDYHCIGMFRYDTEEFSI